MKDLAVSLLALPFRSTDRRPVFTDVLAALRNAFGVDAVALYRPTLAASVDVLAVDAASPALATRIRAGLKRFAATSNDASDDALVADVYDDAYAANGEGALASVRLTDGPALVAVVVVFDAKPLATTALKRLAALAPTLTRRLAAEHAIHDGSSAAGGAAALLDAMPAAGFLADDDGAVLHANAAGHAALVAGGAALAKRITAAAVAGSGRGLNVVPLAEPSDSKRRTLRAVLVAEKRAVAPLARLESFAHENELTPRQIEVLRELLRGSSNRVIAESLACAEVTVEVHVSALLRKGKVKSRAALLAKLWAGG